jgi:hypothetical protein
VRRQKKKVPARTATKTVAIRPYQAMQQKAPISVNVFMNRFRKMGFVEYNGGELKVHSSLVNVILHD